MPLVGSSESTYDSFIFMLRISFTVLVFGNRSIIQLYKQSTIIVLCLKPANQSSFEWYWQNGDPRAVVLTWQLLLIFWQKLELMNEAREE